MKRASGFRRMMQSMFFPDLDNLLLATEELDRRINLMDKSLVSVDKSIVTLDKSVDQLDKGMVQLDHGMTRLDKEMLRLNLGVEQVNKGMDQLNKDVDEREKDLTLRLANLKDKLEKDHERAMGEVAELLDSHSYAERNGISKIHSGLVQPDRARAISELSAALGPRSPIQEPSGAAAAEPDRGRALDELAAMLGSSRRADEPVRNDMKEDADRFAKAAGGQAAPFDFAAILEHIRNRETPL